MPDPARTKPGVFSRFCSPSQRNEGPRSCSICARAEPEIMVRFHVRFHVQRRGLGGLSVGAVARGWCHSLSAMVSASPSVGRREACANEPALAKRRVCRTIATAAAPAASVVPSRGANRFRIATSSSFPLWGPRDPSSGEPDPPLDRWMRRSIPGRARDYGGSGRTMNTGRRLSRITASATEPRSTRATPECP